jgi:HAD superfamily hydrolase (TIGR01548 family)
MLAARFGVTADRVLVTAGADEALDRACRATIDAGLNALVTDPTFEMIPRYVQLAGGDCRAVEWPGGAYPADACVAAADRNTTLVAIVTPNNPTGLVATIEEIRRVHDGVPGALIVVDLAYVEFADEDPTPALLRLPRVLLVRTFSKAWATPDARVGFAMGSPEVIATLRRAGGPFPVAADSLRRAMKATEGEMRDGASAMKQNRAELERRLRSLGVDVERSQGGFVCVAGPRAQWLHDALAGLGIATRLLESNSGLRLRITAPSNGRDSKRVLSAISSALVPDALLFDMDGVLADVSRSYRSAIVKAAKAFGVDVAPTAIDARKAAGDANDDWSITAEFVRAAGVDGSLADVTAAFEAAYQGNDVSPGLAERETLMVSASWLRRLSERVPLAVVTGRPRKDAERLLRRFRIRGAFSAVVTREDAPRKPSREPVREALRRLGATTAWMIGDTPDDVVSARAARVVPIGIAPPDNPAMRDALRTAGAARVVSNAMEVESWLS